MYFFVTFCIFCSLCYLSREESIQRCSSPDEGNCLSTDDVLAENYNNVWTSKRKYILYNVNPGEGFNLRRDVFLRVSIFIHQLRQEEHQPDWVLILPPWIPMYHWRTVTDAKLKMPWSSFFDIECLKSFVPVIELSEFIEQNGPQIDIVYFLQHEDWENGKWEDKALIEKCKKAPPYKINNDMYTDLFWGFKELFALDLACVTVMGHASLLKPIVTNSSTSVIMLDRAEVVLHDNFGDSTYWKARRSMRFAKHLTRIGDEFRRIFLNSTDEHDQTIMNSNCQVHKVEPGLAIGGKYIAAHLRRRDFLHSRKKDIPSLDGAARQLKKLQLSLGIKAIFLATDAPEEEVNYFKTLLPETHVYIPSNEVLNQVKDGGVAIIDQWICAHASYFIGTYESTFSFRIQEEREILGFHSHTTFNRFCGDTQVHCEQPSKWRIVYD